MARKKSLVEKIVIVVSLLGAIAGIATYVFPFSTGPSQEAVVSGKSGVVAQSQSSESDGQQKASVVGDEGRVDQVIK